MKRIMDNTFMTRYRKSNEHLNRAEKTIPLGSQTFSKSRTQYPVGISPLYASKSKGAKIWDVDGNEYIDLVSALASVTIGYGDKGLERAIKKQLKRGVSMSLPGILEAEVAELIIEMVPSAEMVRFGKNGTDATSAAIRLARAYTGRDHIIVCGYHGWQDWYIGSTTRNKGVPESVSALTHKFEYNNINSLKSILSEHEGQIAAVIMEPMNLTYPDPGFLEAVQKVTREAGALLIFDEIITGFRFSRGGAQETFRVIPDLSTFGKGMANGFPLSAVVGRRDIMIEMEEIFFSGTFGGELLSLAAAKYVLEKHIQNSICPDLAVAGANLSRGFEALIQSQNLNSVLNLSGHDSWKFINWNSSNGNSDFELKTLFMQENFKRGLLLLNSFNVTVAHSPKLINSILSRLEESLGSISKGLRNGSIIERLEVEPLEPLFKTR